MDNILLTIVLAPLAGAIIAGLFRNQVGRAGAHWVTILGVGLSCLLSLYVLYQHAFAGAPVYNESVYTWMVSDGLRMEIGFLIDNLTAMMMETDWAARGQPADLVKGGCAISGLFDLAPLIQTSINNEARLDAESAARNSPILHLPAKGGPLIAAVGTKETDGFLEQSRPPDVRLLVEPGF